MCSRKKKPHHKFFAPQICVHRAYRLVNIYVYCCFFVIFDTPSTPLQVSFFFLIIFAIRFSFFLFFFFSNPPLLSTRRHPYKRVERETRVVFVSAYLPVCLFDLFVRIEHGNVWTYYARRRITLPFQLILSPSFFFCFFFVFFFCT